MEKRDPGEGDRLDPEGPPQPRTISFAYMRNLVQQLRDRPIEQVSELPFVQKRLKQYREEEGRMMQVIQDASSFLEEDQPKEISRDRSHPVPAETPPDQEPRLSDLP